MYKLLINLLSRQSIPVPYRICINLVQLTRSNAFCQSMKQTRSSASVSKVRSDIILSIPIAFLVPFSLLNPNWSSPSTSSIFLSILLLSTCAIIFAVCATRLIVRWSLHFVPCGFFLKKIIVNSVKSLGHSPVSYMDSYCRDCLHLHGRRPENWSSRLLWNVAKSVSDCTVFQVDRTARVLTVMPLVCSMWEIFREFNCKYQTDFTAYHFAE